MNNKIYSGSKGGKYYMKNGKKIYLKLNKKRSNKYFQIDLLNIYAGLSHHTSNFKTIIKHCYKNNLKLIKPIFKLDGKHNNSKTIISDLSRYYNLNKITINGEKFKLYDYDINNEKNTIKYNPINDVVRHDTLFLSLSGNVNIPYKKDIIDIAKKISLQMKDYMCIHVRRGDRIKNYQMDNNTKPLNIRKKINEYKPPSVYIMTNKYNELKSLSKDKKIYFYKDFNELKNINDNYYLFCIENEIMKNAKIRCSTFNVLLNNPNNKYYHCYLTNYPGLQ